MSASSCSPPHPAHHEYEHRTHRNPIPIGVIVPWQRGQLGPRTGAARTPRPSKAASHAVASMLRSHMPVSSTNQPGAGTWKRLYTNRPTPFKPGSIFSPVPFSSFPPARHTL